MRHTSARYSKTERMTEARHPDRVGYVLAESTNRLAGFEGFSLMAFIAFVLFSVTFLARPVLAEPVAGEAQAQLEREADPELQEAIEPPAAPAYATLERLFAVPAKVDTRSEAERTDAFLATAIAQKTPASPQRPSAFRKRNLDLFRTERAVEIGDQEMLVRLRLRAKSRETMSVELRF